MRRWRSRNTEHRREYLNAWKKRNPDKVALAQKKSGAKKYATRRALLWALKSKPCVDCGIQYHPAVMDFDHVRGKKEFTIGSHLKTFALQKLLNEIAKCDVVCANCHRARHARRLGYAV